jgi:hypothetical protein
VQGLRDLCQGAGSVGLKGGLKGAVLSVGVNGLVSECSRLG